MESVIRTVLKKMAKKTVGRLPKKSLAAEMMIECELLSKMQVGNTLLNTCNNTLHLNGT